MPVNCEQTRGSRDDETRGGRRQNGMWARCVERRHHPRGVIKTAKGREPHERCRETKTGQAAKTARSAGPEREPKRKAATNDPRGRRFRQLILLSQRGNARREKPHGLTETSRRWVAPRRSPGRMPKRDGPRVGSPRTVRRGRQTLKGRTRPKPHERRPATNCPRPSNGANGTRRGPATTAGVDVALKRAQAE